MEEEEKKIETKRKIQFRKENILNLAHAQYEGTGKYDIPEIRGIKEMPDIKEWMRFDLMLTDKASDEEKKHKGIHFFIEDFLFERIWNNPNEYLDKLSKYGAVLSPDFSPYGDMPLATQIYNHYRKHWCGAYWQDNGITVIPTIRASTDPRSYEFYLEGEPKNSVVAYSSMWISKLYDEGQKEWETMVEVLHPSQIIVYGEIYDFMHGNIVQVDSFAKNWYQKGE